MIRINLLPVRHSRKKLAGRQQLLLCVLGVVFALVCNGLWSRSRSEGLAARESKLRRTRVDIAQLEKVIGEVKSIREQQAAVKDKLAVLDKLKAARQGPVRVLDELASITPERLWLKKLDEKAGHATIDGTALSIDDVSTFLAGLKRSRYFGAPELKKTAARGDAKGTARLVDFTITATVNYAPSAAPSVAGATATTEPGQR